MDFKEIGNRLAAKFNTIPNFNSEAMAFSFSAFGTIPMIVKFTQDIEGIQWFELRVYLGIIVDDSEIDFAGFLLANEQREDSYFLEYAGEALMFAGKEQYALINSTENKDVVEILFIRLAGIMGYTKMHFPGIKFMDGLT
jgi:hypothetical protein